MENIDALCADAHWAELVERRRSMADVFDIISIHETQHSDMLAWLFDSRQGHGQSDAIFRDFLLSIHASGSRESPGDRITGKGLTRDFIVGWTPARVMTTSFSSAMFFREYRLPGADGGRECQLDLLVIDPDNKFIIAIENKAGARFTSNQLGRYVAALQKWRQGRAAFSCFQMAFVALDRNHDDDPDVDECDGRWALLSYSWLERAARRAELAEQRGNRDASIVLSYCRKQLEAEGPGSREISRLARSLAIRHTVAVGSIRAAKEKFLNPANWTAAKLDPKKEDGQVIRFLLQNRAACDQLLKLTQIEMLHGAVVEASQDNELDSDDRSSMGRKRVGYCPRHSVPSVNDYWPFFVRAATEATGFVVRTIWRPKLVPKEHRAVYASLLESGYGRNILLNRGGVLVESRCASIADASASILEMIKRCDEILKRFPG